jgi:glycosyltransferase involved in cell wall biosynthesis
MLKRLERIIIKKADGVVAVCKYIEEIARECDPKSNILRLEDISLLQKSTHKAESLTDTLSISNPIIMYVGNLEAYQGIDLLLESFQRVIQEIAAVNLIIIGGSSEDIKKYRRKSVMLEIHKRTHFIGPRPTSQLESYLKQADILISPRIKGGNTPMKIYSYLDSGKPVLATRLSTHTQVLDDKIAVLTLPDPNSMAEGIISLIADKKIASQIAANARERVKTNFTRDVFKKKLIGFYENIESTITVHKEPHVGGMQ